MLSHYRVVLSYALVGLLAMQIASFASAGTIVALKRGSDLDQTTDGGGAIHADFLAATTANIVNVDVDDTGFHDNTADNNNRGADPTLAFDDMLMKFDVASLSGFTGSVVARAELRIWQIGGNNILTIDRNLHHDVDEDTAVRNSPAGNFADEWGPASSTEFGTGDYGTLVSFDSLPAGARYQVADVTSDVQGFADGSLTNLGWAVISLNRNFATSEFAANGQAPVLFIDFEPADIPEPSTFLLVGLGFSLIGVLRGRTARI